MKTVYSLEKRDSWRLYATKVSVGEWNFKKMIEFYI